MSETDIMFDLQHEIEELKEEIRELKDSIFGYEKYSEALCKKLAERDAEIKALREILFDEVVSKRQTVNLKTKKQ